MKVVVPRIPKWGGVHVQAEGGAEARSGYNGVNASFSEAMDWQIQEGRFISEEDMKNKAKICILGTEVANNLFGSKSPINKEIKIGRGGDRYDRFGRRGQTRIAERFYRCRYNGASRKKPSVWMELRRYDFHSSHNNTRTFYRER